MLPFKERLALHRSCLIREVSLWLCAHTVQKLQLAIFTQNGQTHLPTLNLAKCNCIQLRHIKLVQTLCTGPTWNMLLLYQLAYVWVQHIQMWHFQAEKGSLSEDVSLISNFLNNSFLNVLQDISTFQKFHVDFQNVFCKMRKILIYTIFGSFNV